MTDETPVPACPSCGAPLIGASTCAGCGLRLTGPEAGRLWQIDVALGDLERRRVELLQERGPLLAALRPGAAPLDASLLGRAGSLAPTPTPTAALAPMPGTGPGPWVAPVGPPSVPAASRPVQEWTPQRVQNTLLALGALLLTLAGVVFAAVTYDRLGAGGRATILVALTALAGLAVPRLKGRGLDATAEAVTAVTLALAALDAYGLRTLGLAGSSPASVYAAGSAAVLALAAGLYASAVPVRLPRFAAVVLAHLPVPLLLAHADASPGAAGLAFALLAGADVTAWALLRPAPAGSRLRDVRFAATAIGFGTAWIAALASAFGGFVDGSTPGELGLVVLAAVSAGAAFASGPGPTRVIASALPAPLLATAAYAAAAERLTDAQQPLVLAAVALAAVQTAGLLSRPWRTGPVTGAAGVALAALATQAEAVGQAVVLPLGWLGEPWTRLSVRDARHALSPDRAWDGTVVTLVVLLAAAIVAAGAGLALHRMRMAAVPTAALVVVAAVVLPLGFATSYPLAIVLLLAVITGLLTGAAVAGREDVSVAAMATGSAVAVLAAVWATADRSTTLLALPLLAVLFAVTALRRPEATGLAGLAGGAFLAAAGADRGLAADQVGALLLLAPALLVGLGFVLDGLRRNAAEAAAVLLAATCVVLAHHDPGWLSWTLAVLGLLALAEALHPDRRRVAAAGALLLSASSWVRLADAQVHAPEPYVMPLAVVALILGWLRVRREPATRSFPAYGPGLSLLLVPSLLASFDDDGSTRAVLLLLAALLVLLVGASQRRQAPIVVGGGVLALDALHLLGPYAAALPRWMSLGAVGLLLVGVGATYEQRRRDLSRLRQQFDSLT
jgi:hypothetical protein